MLKCSSLCWIIAYVEVFDKADFAFNGNMKSSGQNLTIFPVGAALFYTSVKDDKNCSLLYKYLVHRIYGFPFSGVASVIEKDSVFM
jgi:hypothetical protein